MTTNTPPELPDSIEQCQALIGAMEQDMRRLQHQVEHLVRRLFGTRSERLDPNQLALFAEAWAQEQVAQSPAVEEVPRKQRPGKRATGASPCRKTCRVSAWSTM